MNTVEGKNGDLRGAAAVHHVRRDLQRNGKCPRKLARGMMEPGGVGVAVLEKTPIRARRVHKVSIVTKPNTE